MKSPHIAPLPPALWATRFDSLGSLPAGVWPVPRWLTFVRDLWPIRTKVLRDPWACAGTVLTLGKLPVTLALLWSAASGALTLTAGLICAYVLMDIFDGVLFRCSHLGDSHRILASRAVLDAHVDRFAVLVTLVPLFLLHEFSSVLFAAFTVREAMLAVLNARPFYAHRILLKPNFPSRVASALMGAITACECVGIATGNVMLGSFVVLAAVGVTRNILHPVLAVDQSV